MVGRDAEHELSAAAHGLLISRQQLRQTFQTCLIVGMPEPMILPQRSVGFDRAPAQISMTINYVPVLVGNDAVLISHPADVTILKKCHIGEYQRVRLGHAKLLNDSREVIHVTAAAGTVEP